MRSRSWGYLPLALSAVLAVAAAPAWGQSDDADNNSDRTANQQRGNQEDRNMTRRGTNVSQRGVNANRRAMNARNAAGGNYQYDYWERGRNPGSGAANQRGANQRSNRGNAARYGGERSFYDPDRRYMRGEYRGDRFGNTQYRDNMTQYPDNRRNRTDADRSRTYRDNRYRSDRSDEGDNTYGNSRYRANRNDMAYRGARGGADDYRDEYRSRRYGPGTYRSNRADVRSGRYAARGDRYRYRDYRDDADYARGRDYYRRDDAQRYRDYETYGPTGEVDNRTPENYGDDRYGSYRDNYPGHGTYGRSGFRDVRGYRASDVYAGYSYGTGDDAYTYYTNDWDGDDDEFDQWYED